MACERVANCHALRVCWYLGDRSSHTGCLAVAICNTIAAPFCEFVRISASCWSLVQRQLYLDVLFAGELCSGNAAVLNNQGQCTWIKHDAFGKYIAR